MAQAYSDPRRESDPTALPDVEVFKHPRDYDLTAGNHDGDVDYTPGWFYWFCFPGCMPDSEPVGPFTTEAEALADAREGSE